MPLHRDIHWIGRQWAVTGRGLQLIDQKQKGAFDIEVSQLWDEALIAAVRANKWLNAADFDKGLEVARERYQDPPPAVAPPKAMIEQAAPIAPLVAAPPIVPTAPVIVSIKPLAAAPAPEQVTKPVEPPPQTPEMIEAEKPIPGKFHMRFLGSAKLIRPWRVRLKK